MILNDRIFGKADVRSKVLLELIRSRPMQRLKGIAQFGIPDGFYHQQNYSRFEHSVGVMVVLKKLGASEEEQIAGLMHDVSHTAFSHTIDWVLGEGDTEDFQDEQHERFMLDSEIPAILERHGYAVERITEYKHFGLLERDLPDVCADRLDYSLREMPDDVVKDCVRALAVKDNCIVFDNESAALTFAENYLELQMEHWGGYEAVSRYRIFGNMMRQALKDGIITMDDFWQDDAFVLNKLTASNNKAIRHCLETLRSKNLDHLPKGDAVAHKKFRRVDPLFMNGNELTRLSESNKDFGRSLEKAREINDQGVILPAMAAQI